jgi:carbamoyl-phosphate synthase small subunit
LRRRRCARRLCWALLTRRCAAKFTTPSARRAQTQDGTVFKGRSFGAEKSIPGEIVFTTNMVGYPESMTDPSFAGQILNLTFPLIGNYGVPGDELDAVGLRRYFESTRIWCDGLLVGDYSDNYSHWNASRSLGDWLKEEGVPALTGIDTRAVTKKIREGGSMLGKIVIGELPEDVPFVDINKQNLVARVSTDELKVFNPEGDLHIMAVDCGMKGNIIRCLVERGAKVTVVPYDYNFNEHPEKWDGLFLSNGPGDPAMCEETVAHVKTAMEQDLPIFGICLGNQLMAQAAGFETYKLKYGNRGQNQPVVDLLTNKAYITPQNHGFAVNHRDLPDQWRPYFINANDGSNEGIIHTMKPFFSVQFHPEARGGPYDTSFLFDKFLNLCWQVKAKGSAVHPLLYPSSVPTKKVLVLGSGGLSIGQAGEFDYSGSQAIKAYNEENIETILVNPNIASIQTSKGLADKVYYLPVTPEFVAEIIKKERPDSIALSFGGQTALNCGVELYTRGILKVSVLLFTVTFYANHDHNLTRSP